VRITPTLVPGATYSMDLTHTIAAGNTSVDVVVNITYSNCTGSASSTTLFNRSVGNVWENVGTITVDPTTNQPSIIFTYASGTMDSSANRWYVDAFRFTNLGDPCTTALPELPTVAGPLEAAQTFVDVPDVNAAAVAVTVYANGVQIGEKTTDVTAGLNRVTTSPLVKGQVITATQRDGSAVNSCRPSTGGIVGGGNPRVRMSLSVRQNTALTGPIGANGGTAGSIIKFLAATNVLPGACPLGGKVIYPSNEWQTVTFLRGPDPANPTDKTFRWNGTDATHDLLGDFGVLESLAFAIDDLTDTGPFHFYIDTLSNGETVIQDFDSFANGAVTVQFNQPSLSGTTSPFLFAPGFPSPNVSRVTDQTSDTGGKSAEVHWQFRDSQNVNWLRLVAQGSGTPNPQLDLRLPITMRILYLPPGTTLPPVPPFITTQPQGGLVVERGFVTLRVVAGGTGPLLYQWFHDGNPVPDATNSSLRLTNFQASLTGAYSVTVSNAVGGVVSDDAVLTVGPAVFSQVMTQLWRLAPGSRYYLNTDGSQRSIAYYSFSGNLLVLSRAPTNAIHVLDSMTGAHLRTLRMDSSTTPGLISGGTFALNKLAVNDEGFIYACNLTEDGTTNAFRIYGWLGDDEGAEPFLAWSGDPGNGVPARWGDSLDARGGGAGTEIIAGSRFGRTVSIIAPLVPSVTVIDTPDAENGNFGLSVVWGLNDTFWGKSSGTDIRHVAFDRGTQQGTVSRTLTGRRSTYVIGVDNARELLAAVVGETPDTLRLHDISSLHSNGNEIDTEFFGTDNANLNGTGGVVFGGDKVFALDSNNGLLALRIGGRLLHSLNGSMLTLTWDGARTLQSTADLSQQFTDVMPQPASPYTVNIGASGNLFFRLKD